MWIVCLEDYSHDMPSFNFYIKINIEGQKYLGMLFTTISNGALRVVIFSRFIKQGVFCHVQNAKIKLSLRIHTFTSLHLQSVVKWYSMLCSDFVNEELMFWSDGTNAQADRYIRWTSFSEDIFYLGGSFIMALDELTRKWCVRTSQRTIKHHVTTCWCHRLPSRLLFKKIELNIYVNFAQRMHVSLQKKKKQKKLCGKPWGS